MTALVQYAENLREGNGREGNGTLGYAIEIMFGKNLVYAQCKYTLRSSDDQQPRFEYVRSVPGPCETAMEDRLAVSESCK